MITSIRAKIWTALAMLILLVSTLAGAGFYAVRLHQQHVRDIAWRVHVLPVARELSRHVSDLQTINSELQGIWSVQQPYSPYAVGYTGDSFRPYLETQFAHKLAGLKQRYEAYRQLLENRVEEIGIEESFAQEFSTVNDIRSAIQELDEAVRLKNWSAGGTSSLDNVKNLLETLRRHTDRLPDYLTEELNRYAHTMKQHSSWLKMIVIIGVIISVVLTIVVIWLSYRWIFKPLHILVEGSRQVASGHYGHRIVLPAKDEIAELASAMNFMTEQFEEKVRQLEESQHDLDEKVKQKSRELVRSERLASVGFLAAGVAHEINNPLMAISACAESLQRRMESVLAKNETGEVKRYLAMIQEEAFRCKGITERLLGLARNESRERTKTDFVPIVTDMLEMIRQQDMFKKKKITLDVPESLEITINAQEMKQVVLNLLTNAFQNTDTEGEVLIRLCSQNNVAILSVQDNGNGMDAEVQHNIFEPFFTRRKTGTGTGLGLSITHRIVEEHRGRISIFSEGPGKGSTFVIELPII